MKTINLIMRMGCSIMLGIGIIIVRSQTGWQQLDGIALIMASGFMLLYLKD